MNPGQSLSGATSGKSEGIRASTPPRLRFPRLSCWPIWFGVVTGLLELGLVYARNHVSGWSSLGSLQISRHFPWMIPLANLVLFLGWGMVVAVLGRIWSVIRGRPSLFLLSFPACLAPLLVIPGLYKTAYLALAAALATWVVRLVWAFPGPFRRLVHVSLPILFFGSALFAGWKGSAIALGEQWAIAALPEPPRQGKNVVLMVMDTVRADHLSLHGYGRDTSPSLKRSPARA